jgi:hypothetical protein
MTSTMPKAQITPPMMSNAECEFVSMTPDKTKGLTGKQAIPRIVKSVLQRTFCHL